MAVSPIARTLNMARPAVWNSRPVVGGSSLAERVTVHAEENPLGHILPGEYTAMVVSHLSPVLMYDANELGKHAESAPKIWPSPETARQA